MFERFTGGARRAVVLAQEEARLLNHGYIGTEHLLLGVLHDSGPAADALQAQGLTLHDVRAAVEARVKRGDSTPSGHIPFTPHAKTALEMGLRSALDIGHNYIAGPHLLLGLLRIEDSQAVKLLADSGIDMDTLRSELLDSAAVPEADAPLLGSSPTGVTVADLHRQLTELRAEVAALRELLEQRLPPPPELMTTE